MKFSSLGKRANNHGEVLWADSSDKVFLQNGRVLVVNLQTKTSYEFFAFSSLPKRILAKFRFAERLLRLNNIVVHIDRSRKFLAIVLNGKIKILDHATGSKITETRLRNCRHILPSAILETKKYLIFGEYGEAEPRHAVPIHKFDLRSLVFSSLQHSAMKGVRHIHSFVETRKGAIIATGDYGSAVKLVEWDTDSDEMRFLVGGSQIFRMVVGYCDKGSLIYMTDSEKEKNYVVVLDLKSHQITSKIPIAGPVIYGIRFGEGALFSTSCEVSKTPFVDGKHVYLYYFSASLGLVILGRFRKDVFPKKLFKYGSIKFARGAVSAACAFCNFEAIRGRDNTWSTLREIL